MIKLKLNYAIKEDCVHHFDVDAGALFRFRKEKELHAWRLICIVVQENFQLPLVYN
jgi:altronate dehydratase